MDATKITESIVGGLKNSPGMLTIVVLNIAMLAVLVFFMRDISASAKANRDQLLEMVSRCLGHDGVLDKQDKTDKQ
jgi:hypothetical protein